jgi:hypothetical protein
MGAQHLSGRRPDAHEGRRERRFRARPPEAAGAAADLTARRDRGGSGSLIVVVASAVRVAPEGGRRPKMRRGKLRSRGMAEIMSCWQPELEAPS